MKIYNSYILIVASLLLLTTVILIATGQSSLDAYYTLYIIEALAVTELYVYFNSRARRGLALINAILFAGFVLALCLRVIKILT